MAEMFFSGFKRLVREVVSAKRFGRMVEKTELKVWVYNLMLGSGEISASSNDKRGRACHSID